MSTAWADTFAGRTVSSTTTNWGTASDGETWSTLAGGGNCTFTVSGGEGTCTTVATPQAMIQKLGSTTGADMDIRVRTQLGASAVGNELVGIFGRISDATHYYRLYITPGAGSQLQLGKKNGGSFTFLINNSGTFSVSAGTYYWLHLRIIGSSIYGNCWADGGTEPQTWMLTTTDTDITSGGVGIACNPQSSTVVDNFDSFSATTIDLALSDTMSVGDGLTGSSQVSTSDSTTLVEVSTLKDASAFTDAVPFGDAVAPTTTFSKSENFNASINTTLWYLSATTTTLSTATGLANVTGGSLGAQALTTLGTATGFGELHAQTYAVAWPSLGTLGSPSGSGYLWDTTALEGWQINAQTFSPSLFLNCSPTTDTIVADIYLRMYKYNNGTYGFIAQGVKSAQTISTGAGYSVPITVPVTQFGPGDKLYIGTWLNVTTNSNADNTLKIDVQGRSSSNLGVLGQNAFGVFSISVGLGELSVTEVDTFNEDTTVLLDAATYADNPILTDNSSLADVTSLIEGSTLTGSNQFADNVSSITIPILTDSNSLSNSHTVVLNEQLIDSGALLVEATTLLSQGPGNFITWSDTFISRTVVSNTAGSWGVASDGEIWSNLNGGTGGTTNWTVASGEGTINSTGSPVTIMKLGSNTGTDMEVSCRIAPGTSTDTIDVFVRLTDSTHYYRLDFTGTSLQIGYKNGGSFTFIASANPGPTLTVGTFYWFRFRVIGTSLYGKLWQDGASEPQNWTVTGTDSSIVAGGVGCGCNPKSATNVQFDTFNAFTITPVDAVFADSLSTAEFLTLTDIGVLSDRVVIVDVNINGPLLLAQTFCRSGLTITTCRGD